MLSVALFVTELKRNIDNRTVLHVLKKYEECVKRERESESEKNSEK